MAQWRFDSDDPNERMDYGYLDTDKQEQGSLYRVRVNGITIGIVPESKIIPKRR